MSAKFLTPDAANCPQQHGYRPGRWTETGDGLRCVDCRVRWPGVQLPAAPPHAREGYDHVARQPRFSERLRAALAQIPDPVTT